MQINQFTNYRRGIVNLKAKALLPPDADLPRLVKGAVIWPIHSHQHSFHRTLNVTIHVRTAVSAVFGGGAGVGVTGVFMVEYEVRTDRGKPSWNGPQYSGRAPRSCFG